MLNADQPRVTDVGHVDDLLGGSDHVDYPCLSREQLVAVGDAPVCADAEDLTWWSELEDPQRTEVVRAGQRSLLARSLVSLSPDHAGRLVLAPELQTVVAVRRAPAFVSVCGGEAGHDPALRCFGVRLDGSPAFAVLIEARILPGVSDFVLATPAYAATAVTRFVLAPPAADDPAATPVVGPLQRVVVRRLQLFPPGRWSGGERIRAFAGVTAGAVQDVPEDGPPTEPSATTEAALVDRILASWHAAIETGSRLSADEAAR